MGCTAYLTRVIFCEMVAGDEMSETGFGISTTMQDNEYPILVVDDSKQEITVVQYTQSPSTPMGAPLWNGPYQDFIDHVEHRGPTFSDSFTS